MQLQKQAIPCVRKCQLFGGDLEYVICSILLAIKSLICF